jgi:hypothetical protein
MAWYIPGAAEENNCRDIPGVAEDGTPGMSDGWRAPKGGKGA